VASGVDVLDTILCDLGVLARTPLRGHQRRMRGGRLTPAQLAARSRIPERFRQAHVLYLENYAERVSDVYATTRHKHNALEHLWVFLDERYPEVRGCAEVRRAHLLAFIPEAKRLVREVRRDSPGTDPEDRMTAHQWLTTVRCFFGDICTWSLEDGSPFAGLAPPAVPLERHYLKGQGFDKIRRRQAKRAAAAILDLEREVPRIRAIALRRWHEAEQPAGPAEDPRGQLAELNAFWDWAVLELLVQSGVRIEEASELTTLDVLRRQQPDGKVYYLLHVKPSKYERARVIPIGDGLGRVIAEIIRHVKRFYGTDHVPSCDHWDHAEKRARPRAPYLLQGAGHPSALAMEGIRNRLARLSRLAETRRADGQPLILRPHDCRRLFASELLNNSVAPHVIQALLGHAHIDTVMIYAKLYPSTLVEDYRKAVRSSYTDFHGPDSLRAPTPAEWEEFSRSCNLREPARATSGSRRRTSRPGARARSAIGC
jgi:integrase